MFLRGLGEVVKEAADGRDSIIHTIDKTPESLNVSSSCLEVHRAVVMLGLLDLGV